MWNKMMEEKEGAGRRNSKEGFEENENACIVERVSVVPDTTACLYLKLACLNQTNQSSSKLQQFPT